MDSVDISNLRFECTKCGACCKRPGWIFLQEGEPERIAAFLGVPLPLFLGRHLVDAGEGDLAIEVPEGEGCPFLEKDLCTIQDVKPAQCSSYPFWLELLSDRAVWNEEATFCEGIGRGEVLPLATVHRFALLDPGLPGTGSGDPAGPEED